MDLLKSLFENAQLPTDFETKATTLFEAAVEEKVKEQLASLQESFDKQLAEQKDAFIAESAETIDTLVKEAIVEWAKENSVGLDGQIKASIAEQFLGGLKGLFEQAEVKIQGDTAGEIQKLQEQVAELTKTVTEKETALTEANAVLVAGKIKTIIESVTTGLADTEIHRITKLCEAFEFKSEEDFTAKAKLVKEAVTGGASSAPHSPGDGRPGSALAAEPHKNEFNVPSDGQGDHGDGKSALAAKEKKEGGFDVHVQSGIKGTYNNDGTTVPVMKEGSEEQTPEEEKAALKEAFDKTRQLHAPHYGEDLVAATLALMK